MSKRDIKQPISKRDIWLISIAGALMLVATTIQYVFMQNSMFEEATLRAKSELTVASQRIETAVTNVEAASSTMAYRVAQNLLEPDALYDFATKIVKDNPNIDKCTIAFKERTARPDMSEAAYAIQCYREAGQILRKRLPKSYLGEEWFKKFTNQETAFWDEPYLDNDKLVTKYVCPISNHYNFVVAALAVDVPTEGLTKEIKGLPEYPNSYAKLISEKGYKIIGPNEYVKEEKALHFTNPIGKVGWNLTVVCPDADINHNIEVQRIVVLAMQCLSVLLLVFIVIKALVNLKKLRKATEEKNRMGSELESAQRVQTSMILTKRDMLPQRKNLKMNVRTINACEVSGDFYDGFIRDEQLYFCIGDVSGTGAPAALTMAMALSAFRTSALYTESPSQLMSDINSSICRKNEETATVKMLCGVLNLVSGQLLFCNAGTHSPILLTESDYNEIEVADNPRVGINANISFKEQKMQLVDESTLFLYTDGLTEAENRKGQQWGVKHVMAQLSSTTRMNLDELLERISEAVAKHVKGTKLPDDITLMGIRYKLS